MAPPVIRVPCSIWRPTGVSDGMRALPEETAVVFTYDTGTYAATMATPSDIEVFTHPHRLAREQTSHVA